MTQALPELQCLSRPILDEEEELGRVYYNPESTTTPDWSVASPLQLLWIPRLFDHTTIALAPSSLAFDLMGDYSPLWALGVSRHLYFVVPNSYHGL